ncbi:MAG: site-specific DNA-methyltransferase [Clostridiales Family XIII bacterium]|jgi:site-specific DNA-methyltransferase (adenine-specific)|nr:site-specific DNA-methyltransferase [Clostridiales Family XIII bacterium]
MAKESKSARNKTIDFSFEEGKEFFARCSNGKDLSFNAIINKTINGDTFEILSRMPKKFVDLLIIDPPYNLSKNYHSRKFKEMKDSDYAEYTEKWLKLAMPLLKDEASIYICCDWKTSVIIGNILPKYLNVRNRITWQREKGRGAKENWKNSMEDIWFATNNGRWVFNLDAVKVRKKVIAPYKVDGKPKDWQETDDGNFRDTCPSNFWNDISIPYWSMSENTAHPTQKPEKLIAKLILASSNKGDVIFDPFLGSGTTSVTAKKLGRKYVGIELDKTYCAWAEKRLENAENDLEIQGYTDGVFWERNTLGEQKKAKSNLSGKPSSKENYGQASLLVN